MSDQVLSDLLSEPRVRLSIAFVFLDRTRAFGEKNLSIGTSVMYLRLKFYEPGVP